MTQIHSLWGSKVSDLARRVAPILLLDRSEPFRPVALGVTEFTSDGQSPSSKFAIEPRADRCIEYAIFWDWDIGHLYDLEHVWVHLDATNSVIAVEATFHGNRHDIDLALSNGKPMIWCEAGKHAHFQNRAQRDGLSEATSFMTGPDAGVGGVHTGNPFSKKFGPISAQDHRLASLYLRRLSFVPSLGRPLAFDLAESSLCPWPELEAFIPQRVRHLLDSLDRDMPHFRTLFFDCGDTLVDEGTEVKRDDGSDVVIKADLISGAVETIAALKALGYRLCLVADGPRETFANVLKPANLWDAFDAHVISGDIGVRKPDGRMFAAAMEAMGLSPDLAGQVPMIGNNLDRDIAGANAAGHPSIFFNWSDRRRRVHNGPEDAPTRQFTRLEQLPGILTHMETALDQKVLT